ncbi:MAG: FtsX-like permease family protein, partial [Acidisphaera sp.]|nr:FtsX-like permease family protein [Acidisphaera sp.]
LAEFHLRAAFAPGTDIPRVLADLRAAFPNTGWRLRDAAAAAPGVVQFIDRTSLFLTLVGLTSLLVGGIGVANGVRAWLEARSRSIATLRCLGASGALVLLVCLTEVMALACFGVLVGVAVGALLPSVAVWVLGDLLPVRPELGLFPRPLALAAFYGVLVAATFALWPLGRAMRIPGGALFRDELLPAHIRPPRLLIAVNVALAAALIALTIGTAEQPGFAAWFCAAAAGTLALFRLGGSALMRLARSVRPPSRAWARLGLANIYRPGAATPLMLVSLGLGLSTLAAVALIEGNVQREITDQMPANAPSFFFVDIQNDQVGRFEQIVASVPGTSDVRQVPSLRARVVAVNGVPADEVHATQGTAWALRGDRGLTYAAAEPAGTRLLAGAWWPSDYGGPPLVSFDANLAQGWGVKVGDTIRVNVLGRDIDLRIANLRDIAWRSLGLNFTMIASPGLLEHAPQMHIATVRAPDPQQGALLRAVTDALPNVSGIRVADVLAAIGVLLNQLGTALIASGSLTLVAGALVLAGAVAAGQRRRIREAVILKTLGATRAQVRGAWMVEFGLLGLTAGVIAAAVGTAASFSVIRYVMHTDWRFLPGTLAATILGCVAGMLLFGYAGTEAALRAKAAPLLRNE